MAARGLFFEGENTHHGKVYLKNKGLNVLDRSVFLLMGFWVTSF
jgi:hypothetical protein